VKRQAEKGQGEKKEKVREERVGRKERENERGKLRQMCRRM
jgi:hypothetical protein